MDELKFVQKAEKYSDMIYRIAYTFLKNRCDAEDVSQEVFLKLYYLDHEIESEESEKAWLIRVTLNKCKDIKKSAWFTRRSEQNEVISPEIFCSQDESNLYKAVFNMPEKYRVVMFLYYHEEYSVNEISRITGKNQSTIRTQLERARKNLKKQLTQKGGEFYERNRLHKCNEADQNV